MLAVLVFRSLCQQARVGWRFVPQLQTADHRGSPQDANDVREMQGEEMKLRTAKKILKAIGTAEENRYTPKQCDIAIRRYERTKGSRSAHRCWKNLMDYLGVDGRAAVLQGTGAPGMAFNLLMRSQGMGLERKLTEQ